MQSSGTPSLAGCRATEFAAHVGTPDHPKTTLRLRTVIGCYWELAPACNICSESLFLALHKYHWLGRAVITSPKMPSQAAVVFAKMSLKLLLMFGVQHFVLEDVLQDFVPADV